ncbi:hypothetical protein IMSHALPRED_001820 [Imshaugia aleurites]|uniref:Uncharacterized protein n=1 Tax=Imshaugia aleurites TaxID=172621 RepID=A0A8H3PGP9_9LECA|nr:hypothetical protein IMSHALPRED_001820 [Imshaugia aleurites]
MASIPLLCNICPKEPEFSDISHLLTHVASKGHLAQELKAKVRSRQDVSIREKLVVYDRWYEKHQIERLLSQRLILKESKDTSSRVKRSVNSPSAGSAKNVKPPKKRAKTSDKVPEASPVKSEDPPIDPQLSWFPPSTPSPFLRRLGLGGLSQHDQALNHRYHVPRMCGEQAVTANRRAAVASTPSKVPSGQRLSQDPWPDTDSENDYFNTFIRSPTRTAYPDPSDLLGLPVGFSLPQTTEQARERVNSTPVPNGRNTEKAEPMQPPVLKGVRWPGMSIFDSASLEAQRLRNQKKDGSKLEQMEHNSAEVEQMERIYWPDGSLKQKRLITGNVESSPLKEPTPPPKRPRNKAKKTVLTDISTNAPKPTRRPRKTDRQLPSKQVSDLRNISKKALATLDPPPPQSVYPRSAHMGYDAANEEDLERRLTSGILSHGRRQVFDVFKDNVASGGSESGPATRPAKPGVKSEDYPFLHSIHGHHGPSHSQVANLPARRSPLAPLKPSATNQIRIMPDGMPWDAQTRPLVNDSKHSPAEEDSENIEPILDGAGRVDDQAHNERITQRYFSVTGNQPPQFFNSLPPHMDFGGLAEPKYHGSTLNLLNPYLRQQYIYPPLLFNHTAPSFFASHQDDIGKGGLPALSKEERGNKG